MDESIYKCIKRCNFQLSLNKRKGMISQICHKLEYMHHKGILHRDISLFNVFVMHYEDMDVCKIGNFDLIKIPENNLTSTYFEIKCLHNAHDLIHVGFGNYKICHKIYALTGKTNVTKEKDGKIKQYWKKGSQHKS